MKKLALALAGVALAAVPAAAQEWKPTRNVEYIVPSGAGAALDSGARMIKEVIERYKLSPTSMIVTNKPGGAGMVALSVFNQKAGDPHVLAHMTHSTINNPLIGTATLGTKDFTPIAILVDETLIVAVRADSPIKTGKDLIERLKKDPGSVRFGVATAVGNHIHIGLAVPLKAAGVDIKKLTVAAFKSSAQSMTALLGGHLDAVSASAPNAVKLAEAGKIRVIATAAGKRMTGSMSKVPTWKEQGVDAEFSSSQGVLGAKGITPAQIIFWESALRKVVETKEWKALLERNHWRPRFLGHKEAVAFIAREEAKLKGILAELGMLKKK